MKIGVCFRNALGNFILFTSILRVLSSIAKIDLILDETWQGETRESINSIVYHLDFVSEVINYPSEFDKSKYDHIYMSAHSVFDNVANDLFKDKIFDPENLPEWGEQFYHELDFLYMEIIKQFNYKGRRYKPVFPKLHELRSELYDPVMDSEDIIKICIANGYQRTQTMMWAKKSYPHWQEVIDELTKFYGNVIFFLIGGKEDKEWGNSLYGENIKNYIGKTDILETGYIINKSNVFMSNDTGSFHIADALGVRGVVVFGPSLVSKNGPLNGNIIPLISPKECAGCQSTVYFQTCNDSDCLKQIESRYIISAVRKLIKETPFL